MVHLRNLQICYLRINQKKFGAFEFADSHTSEICGFAFCGLKKKHLCAHLNICAPTFIDKYSISIRNISSFFFKEQKRTITIFFTFELNCLPALFSWFFCYLFLLATFLNFPNIQRNNNFLYPFWVI